MQVGSGGCAVGRMALCSLTARVWLIDSSPAGNIHRRDVVGEPGVSAGHTGEGTLIGTIGFRDMPALRTGLRRVAWVNRDDRNAHQRCLVLDFCPEITKGPAMQLSPVRLPNRYPVADTRQVFNGDPTSGVFGALYKLLADTVVHISGKAVLFVAAPLEQTFGRLCTLLLKLGPQPCLTVAQAIQVGARIIGPVAVGGDVRHTHIDTEIAVNVPRLRGFNFTGDKQVKLAVDVAQVRLTPVAFQQLALAVAAQVTHALTALQRPDANHLFVSLETKNTVIVGECPARLEGSPRFSVELVGVGDFADSPYRHLCGQPVAFPDIVIDEVVKGILLEYLAVPCLLADVVAGSVGRLKRVEQRVVLVVCGFQFDLRRQFHIGNISHFGKRRKAAPCPFFLSPLKEGVPKWRFDE